MLANAVVMVFAVAMIYAAISDLLTMTIPNKISIVLAGVFPIAALVAGLGWAEFFSHLAAGVVVLAAGIALFSARILGGGDAKLLAAASLWLGFDLLLPFFVYVAMFGGGLALAIIVYRRLPTAVPAGAAWAMRLHDRTGGIPYGVAITPAALLIFTKTSLYAQLMS